MFARLSRTSSHPIPPLCDGIGAVSGHQHHFPVRVARDAQFHGLAPFVERVDPGYGKSGFPGGGGAMDVLREAGRRVPSDVGIVGFDDSSWALRCSPRLSTVRQPSETLGRRAAEQVLSQLRGEEPVANLMLETEVVWRDSA